VVREIPRSIQLFQSLGFRSYHDSDQDWAMLFYANTTLSFVSGAEKVEPRVGHGHSAHIALTAFTREEVDRQHAFLKENYTQLTLSKIECHRDSSYGFYFEDYDHNVFEFIYIPSIPLQNLDQLREAKTLKVLLSHGSRQETWKEWVLKIKEYLDYELEQSSWDYAFLEFSEKNLEEVVNNSSAEHFEIFPLFLGRGKHVREDIQVIVKKLSMNHQGKSFELYPALCEDELLLRQISQSLLRNFYEKNYGGPVK